MAFEEWWSNHPIQLNPAPLASLKGAFKEVAQSAWNAAISECKEGECLFMSECGHSVCLLQDCAYWQPTN